MKIKTITKQDLETILREQLHKAGEKKLHDFNFWKTRGVIEYIDNDPQTIGLVSLTGTQIVNLDVLDLAMFNPAGEVALDIAASSPAALHMGLARRLTKLKAQHKKLHQYILACQLALQPVKGTWPKELTQGLLPKLSLYDKLGQAILTGTTFTFGMKRVKTLRESYAKNLLDKYTRHLARPGDLHDFAN